MRSSKALYLYYQTEGKGDRRGVFIIGLGVFVCVLELSYLYLSIHILYLYTIPPPLPQTHGAKAK